MVFHDYLFCPAWFSSGVFFVSLKQKMKTSYKGIELIKRWESLHDGSLKEIGLQPKMCPRGIWTEGYGHAIRDDNGKFVRGASEEQRARKFAKIDNDNDICDIEEAEDLLIQDLEVYERIVMQRVKIPLTQNQFDSLISHTYNTGGSETLFTLVNNRATSKEIWDWFTKHYITVDGVKLKGLVNRRKEEAIMFFK